MRLPKVWDFVVVITRYHGSTGPSLFKSTHRVKACTDDDAANLALARARIADARAATRGGKIRSKIRKIQGYYGYQFPEGFPKGYRW